MRKKILYFTTIAVIMFFGACSKEEVPETARTISLTASMPDDDAPATTASMVNGDPATRVTLTPDSLTIKLHWEVGDEIRLLFVQGTKDARANTAKVDSISEDGKKAYFTIAVPSGITAADPFNLYGVYGGPDGDISGKIAYFPQRDNTKLGSLADIKTRKDVMLRFAYNFGDSFNQDVSVSFKHLGSLFCIHLKNNSSASDLADFDEARLVGVNNLENQGWGYNATNTHDAFNVETNTFLINDDIGLTNYIRMKPKTNGLLKGESKEIWAWYPPLPDKTWPELKLELRKWTGGTEIATSNNSKPTRIAPTPAGRTFHFYAVWDGTNLNFVTQAAYEALP